MKTLGHLGTPAFMVSYFSEFIVMVFGSWQCW